MWRSRRSGLGCWWPSPTFASTGPRYAELAVVVTHHQHERGVGTALLGELGRVALRRGQRHLVDDVLAENYEMCRVMRDLHWHCTQHLDGSVLRVDIDLTREQG
jgi:hypothetical protein